MSMPKILLTIAAVLVASAIALYVHQKFIALPAGAYKWNGVVIHPQTPLSDDPNSIAAKWGPAEVFYREIWLLNPALQKKSKLNSDVEQLAYDSEYYFNFLSTSQNLLVQKLTQHFSKLEKLSSEEWVQKTISQYTKEADDFEKWKVSQNIKELKILPEQKETILSDFRLKHRNQELHKFFASQIKGALQIFSKPPGETMQLPLEGDAAIGSSKASPTGLFLCDLISRGCFQAIETLQKVAKENEIKINFKLVLAGQEMYSTLRSQIGICLSQIDPSHFWSYVQSIKSQPERTEEPTLYELTGLQEPRLGQLRSCMVSSELRSKWEQNNRFFRTLWNPALPAIVLFGEPIFGPFHEDRISELVARRKR